MKLFTTALALAVVTTSFAVQAQEITGAGATFPAPVYGKWGEAAKAAIGVTLNYQGIGSGGGQNQISNRTVDFGASDAPMAADKLDAAKLLQFPAVMGAVTPIVNLPGINSDELKLTGEILADIYRGKITKWNDEKLVELNRDLKLPNVAIAPVYRADGSGTTFVFTSYLSAVSPEWKTEVGASQSVKWPAGNGAKGNDGIAATVKQVRGGIGYVEENVMPRLYREMPLNSIWDGSGNVMCLDVLRALRGEAREVLLDELNAARGQHPAYDAALAALRTEPDPAQARRTTPST